MNFYNEQSASHDELTNDHQDEIMRTKREMAEDNELVISHSWQPDLTLLRPDQPDIIITVDADEAACSYSYQLQDSGVVLSCTGGGKRAGAEVSALRLSAATIALKSILRKNINQRIALRYNYATRTLAIESERKLIIEVRTTDSELLAMGRTISEALSRDAVPFLTPSTDLAYMALTRQLRRFEVKWSTASVNSPQFVALRAWVQRNLGGVRSIIAVVAA